MWLIYKPLEYIFVFGQILKYHIRWNKSTCSHWVIYWLFTLNELISSKSIQWCDFIITTMQSLHNNLHRYNRLWYNIWSCCGSHIFVLYGIVQRNYRKMTISWSFFYNYFVKLPLLNTVHFKHSLLILCVDPKPIIKKGLNCNIGYENVEIDLWIL